MSSDPYDQFFIIRRSLLYHELWLSEPFDKARAWVDLIGLANHSDSMIVRRGIEVHLKRGDVGWGERELAARWKWSRTKLRAYVANLSRRNMIQKIQRGNTSVSNVIHLTKYDSLQQLINKKDTEDNTEERPKKIPEELIINNVKNICPASEIADLYNEHCPDLKKLVKLNEKRRTRIKVVWEERKAHRDLSWWVNLFSTANGIPWMRKDKQKTGGKHDNWVADLDYVISDTGIVKVLEYEGADNGVKRVCENCTYFTYPGATCSKERKIGHSCGKFQPMTRRN